MTISWVTAAGSLGTFQERQTISIPINATSDLGNVTYEVISGSLPRGLRLNGPSIVGTPTEVRKYTESRFVIRAKDSSDLEDRTFAISIDGADAPRWITEEGFLQVGQGEAYYALDNSYIDFQLEARDTDEIAGDTLEYYLVPNGGELPPGLTLTTQGRIYGFTDPIFAVEYNENYTGSYDTSAFDVLPLDVPQARSNGFDSYFYDAVTFDYNEPVRSPRRLSRPYAFVVSATDGRSEIRRLFKIYIVTEEFLKADNSIVQVDTNLFRADSSGDRVPQWITPGYLGRRRANNYLTIFLDVYDPTEFTGTIVYYKSDTNPGSYKLKETGEITTDGKYEISDILPKFTYNLRGNWSNAVNYKIGDAVIYNRLTWVCIANHSNQTPAENSYWSNELINTQLGKFTAPNSSYWEVIEKETDSVFPPGLTLDNLSGDLAGKVPYQSAVTRTYKFTMIAVNFPADLTESTLRGDWNGTSTYFEGESVRYEGFIYVAIADNQNQTPDTSTDYWRLGVSTSEKTFTIDIIGEIESAIEWISDSDLGTIKPNQPSRKQLEAKSLLYGNLAIYELVSGSLPPGLSLLGTGLIVGKVRQFGDLNQGIVGLTRFYERTDSINANEDSSTGSRAYTTTFDDDTTTFDKKFTFNVKARDTANYAESIKEFSITVVTDNQKTFANLYMVALQSKLNRLNWFNFITDANIFKIEDIYRYGDSNFGVQSEIKMLVFAGIESVEAVKFVQAMSRNHYRKQIKFGEVKKALAKDPTTQEVVYEAVYVEIVDEFETNGVSISDTINLPDNINSKVIISYDAIKVDSDIPFVSDSDHQRVFPNSIKNMRKRIKSIGNRDRDFLPLWMRSTQIISPVELGYTKALVLCYAKSGRGDYIISRIKASGFDFKKIDFTADRYLIDVLEGEIENKYLAFPQRGEKLP